MGYLVNYQELFPTKFSFILFCLYVSLFVNQGWLVTASQKDNFSYEYNTTFAVFITEIIKLLASIVIYKLSHPWSKIVDEFRHNGRVFALYFIPASLYCLYNNLTYINLSNFDPTTYFMLLQLRVVATGFIFQVLFKRKLNFKQWASLILLTLGCMVKQINLGDMPVEAATNAEPAKQLQVSWSYPSFLLFIQLLCSCSAGVYNEYLLKSHSAQVNVLVQNVFHNINSIACILLVFTYEGTLSGLFSPASYEPFLEPKVALVVGNNAAIGVVTSFFLNYLNSIVKNFASSLELVITAVISRILFSIPVYANTVVSIVLIAVATVTYSQNPVVNKPPVDAVGKNGKYLLTA